MLRRTRRVLLAAIAVLVVVNVVLLATWPHIFRAAVLARIQAMTGRAATAETLALDLRHGTLTVRGFTLADRDGGTLATIGRLDATIRLRSLLAGHLWIRDLAVRDSTVRVVRLSAHEFNIDDIIDRHRGRPSSGRRLDVTVDRFELSDSTVVLEDRSLEPDRTWKSENIRITARNVSTRRDDGEVEGSTTVDGSPVSLAMERLRLYPVHFEAVIRARQVDLAVARLYLPADAPVVLDHGRLDTTVKVALDARGGLQADVDGHALDVRLIRRQHRDPFLIAPDIRLTVEGLAVGPHGGVAVGRVALAGASTLINGDASPPARFELPRVTLSAEGLAWPVQGPARVQLASNVPGGGELTVRGAVRPKPASADVRVRLTRVNLEPWARYLAPALRVAGAGELALDVQAALESGVKAVGRGSARVTGVTVVEGDRRILALEQAEVADLDLQWPLRATIGRVRLRRPDVVVERDAAGAIVMPTLTRAAPAEASPGAIRLGRAPAPALTVAVNQVAVEDGALTWRDRAVKPATAVRVTGVRLVVKEPTWPLGEPVAVQIRAATPEGGTLDARGRVGLQPVAADLTVTARGVALAPYAPYLRLTAPVRGFADADVAATVTRDPDLQARVRGTAAVGRVSVADGNRRVLSVERAEARGIDVDWPGRVSVARLALRQPWALVERDERGAFPLRRLLASPGAGGERADAPAAAPAAAPPAIAVGELVVEDGGARVVDRAISPPYAEDFSRLWLRARGLATASDKPAHLDLRATVGSAGAVLVRGTVGALDGPLALDLAAEVRELAVSRLNPYIRHFAGWSATEGRLSTKITCRIDGGALAATSDTRLGRLRVVRTAPDEAGQQRIGLPLGLVVALLKDSRGDIRLSLPVGGRLNDPKFDFHDAIWSAVRAVAVKTIALPVSWVGRLRFGRDSKIEDVEIDPFVFEPGTATLAAESSPRVGRLADFMKSLPDVRMIATPVVSLGDLEALKAKSLAARLKALAAERRVPEADAARRLFAERFPGHEPPDDVERTLTALREVEEPPAREAAALAKDRADLVRDALKKAGIDGDRIAINKEPGALETYDAGRVEFGVTDRLKPRRTLADLLRALVEALQRRLTALRSR